MLRRLLEGVSVDGAVRLAGTINLSAVDPFRVVLFHERDVGVLIFDGRETRVEREPLMAPLVWSSSSLGDAIVEGPRRQLFERMLGDDAKGWLSAQAQFHRHRWPLRPEISVCMSRHDAWTVSRTVVDVSPGTASMAYESLVEVQEWSLAC